jgi:hypothetical protein
MRWHPVPTLAALALLALLNGCGSQEAVDGAEHAQDPGTPTRGTTPTSDPGSALSSGPPWPLYDVEDYTFTLRVHCFCPDAGVPVTITVTDGEVVDAVFAKKRSSRPAGAPAPEWRRVTINDVIGAANDTDAYTVDVRWPAGQDYPTSVWVDRDADTIDEEIGYTIRDVDPA